MDTLKVRITKAAKDSYWDASKVGEVFEVVADPDNYTVKGDGLKEVGIASYQIGKDDCVVEEDGHDEEPDPFEDILVSEASQAQSMLDLMGVPELREQLEEQSNIIVQVEIENARIRRVLSMAMRMKARYAKDLEAYRMIYGPLKKGGE